MEYVANDNRYSEMVYNRCGTSGLRLPIVSLGLWHNFGGTDVFENFRKVIWHAFDRGITHFDLANNYGPPPGSAEENFGRILNKDFSSYRDEMIISSKAGYLMWPGPYGEWGSKKYLVSSLDQSLRRMHLDYVDIFYSHRPDPDTPMEETMAALDLIVRQGKALYAGISNYTAEQSEKAIQILNDLGTPCLIHQPRYSMFDRWVEKGLLDVLKKFGVGCIVFSPLAQGLLTDRYLKGIPEGSRASKGVFLTADMIDEKTLSKIHRLNEIALHRKQTLAEMALSWILKDKSITSVLIGASSVAQLDDNLKALSSVPFSDKELLEIEHVLI